MILNVVLVLAALAVIYGAVKNGLYGAVVTFFLATIAAVVALSFYHPVSKGVIAEYFPGISEHSDAIAFMGLFIVVLFLCQLVARAYLADRLQFTKAFDVGVALLVGCLTSVIVTGVLSVGYFMLPTKATRFYSGGSVLAGLDVKFVAYAGRVAERLGASSERLDGKKFSAKDFVEYYKKTFSEAPPAPPGLRPQ